MEILSDATFKGNVSINGGDFSITRKGESTPLLTSGSGDKLLINDNICVYGDVYINGALEANCLWGIRSIRLNGSLPITEWSDLNNILCFAPSSLSTTVSSLCTTVSSNTTKINSACSTISSLCTTVSSNTTKIDSLCTAVSNIKQNTKHVFGNPPIPIGCTKFYFEENPMAGLKEYKFIVSDVNFAYEPSFTKVFKGGYDFVNEEVQMDVKQYRSGNMRWFEGALSSNTTGYGPTEFILIFDEFKELCTTETVPQ